MDSSTEGTEGIVVAGDICADAGTKKQVQDLYRVLQTVTDRRQQRGRRFEMAAVLTVMLVAKMAGENTLLGIVDWARLWLDWLAQVVPLRAGPCANTYLNICAKIDAVELSAKVAAILSGGAVALPADVESDTDAAPPPLRHLACDGKAHRGSHRAGTDAQQVLGIFDVTAQCMQAQLPITDKGHVSEAFTTWLGEQAQHQLDGCVITADALHTHANVGAAIRHCGGDYLFFLFFVKGNQPTLHEDIRLLFSEPPNRLMPEQSARTVDTGHGRREVRHLRTSTALNHYWDATWPDLAQVFQVERRITRTQQGVTKAITETAYCITSLSTTRASPDQLLAYTRAHWQIENRSHWRRDVTLRADVTQLASKPASMVIAALNNTLLALLDRCGVTNVRRAMRHFAAHPETALSLIISTS